MTYNLRLTAVPQTVEGETRYALIDHHNQHWGLHSESGYRYSIDEIYMKGASDQLAHWRKWTSANSEEAFLEHGPVSNEYTIIPPETRLVKIRIEFLAELQRMDTFYIFAKPFPRFNLHPEPGEYYGFTTIDDAQEMFLYSDIKHISFKEF